MIERVRKLNCVSLRCWAGSPRLEVVMIDQLLHHRDAEALAVDHLLISLRVDGGGCIASVGGFAVRLVVVRVFVVEHEDVMQLE